MNKWIILLCGALAGCQISPKEEADGNACQTINLATVLDREPTGIKLDEWAKSVRFIPLETTDSVLLNAYIPQLVYFQDKLVIYNNEKIYLFNPEGKFIRMIGNKGEGPEEFLAAGNLSVDEEGIHIEDYCKWIKTYGWDGKWKRTTSVPANINIQEVLPLPDGRNIGYVQNISGKEPTRMYLFRDSTVLDSIPYARSFEPGEIKMVFYSECKAFSTPSGDYVKEMFNDTIYRITKENTLAARWMVDAGQYKMPEGGRYQLQDPRNSLFQEKKAAHISVVGNSNGLLYLTANLNGKSYLVCYDEKDGKTESVKLPYPEHHFEFKEENTFVPRFVSEDSRYLIGYEAQENDENPVIILAER
ncbi:6-bladed beta-propeller [Parabacteroides sp. AF17-28]|uniref:6-bladed beta-propeller n=1 Tax=Parabacteroides sp. AF17-28 TaxID=2292241 RepID=UPI000EFF7330|nr:6-bladed beta-propeller [Parabacteroides sp. AF17-28]RHR61024.1 6-bladed beta-propeller [Parabacteroides sp. AF17-28]